MHGPFMHADNTFLKSHTVLPMCKIYNIFFPSEWQELVHMHLIPFILYLHVSTDVQWSVTLIVLQNKNEQCSL